MDLSQTDFPDFDNVLKQTDSLAYLPVFLVCTGKGVL
jgi:hypothetical protein